MTQPSPATPPLRAAQAPAAGSSAGAPPALPRRGAAASRPESAPQDQTARAMVPTGTALQTSPQSPIDAVAGEPRRIVGETSRERSGDATASPTPGGRLSGGLRALVRAITGSRNDNNWRDTIEELIEDSEPETEVATHERTLLSNILRLKDLTAYDVMVPRVDIIALDARTLIRDALQKLAEKPHSRIPVFHDHLDDVVGVIHIKDVLAYLEEPAQGADLTLDHIKRDTLIIAPSMPVLDLLVDMRQSRRHMALVVDEYGGIDGLITIEDLVEEIVGDIEDEHGGDTAPKLIERPDGSFIADARYDLADFEAQVGLQLHNGEDEDIDTLGGLVFTLAGRIPARGELLNHTAGLEFEVVEADPRRVHNLRIRRVAPSETPPAENGK